MPLALSPNRSWLQQLGLVFVVLVMSIGLSVAGHVNRLDETRPNTFLNKGNLVENVATPMSYYAIMAVGVTIVIITGGIDISVGSIMALSAMLTAWLIGNLPPDAPPTKVLPIAIGLPALIGVVCGLINGGLITLLRIHPFIVTLGTMGIFRCLATVLPPQRTMPAMPRKVPLAFTQDFMRLEWLDVRFMPMVVMLVVAVAGALFLKFFVVGVQAYAIGGNEEASRLSGLRVNRVKILCYALSGLCAGIAGTVTLGYYGTANATTGLGYELTVVAAAVVGGASLSGGRGTAIGALLGALVIGLIENGISILQWNQANRLGIIGAAIIIAVALDRLSERLSGRTRA